jgi:hypothetical protein
MSQIEIDFGTNQHQLTLPEAGILRSLLSMKRSLAAVVLARSVREASRAPSPDAIPVGPEHIAAIRGVLENTNFGGFPGLQGLQTAVRSEKP